MTTYVAFLRAINLGATRKFPKDAIVAATEAAGFDDVATRINTGNVRLGTAMRSRARIESALEQAYLADRGFEVPTIVYSQAELREVHLRPSNVLELEPGGGTSLKSGAALRAACGLRWAAERETVKIDPLKLKVRPRR